jgi:hypothetical protein
MHQPFTTKQIAIMDPIVMDNTRKYARKVVINGVTKCKNVDLLEKKEIYVVNHETDTTAWRAVLIDSYCQSGKTKRCFEVLHDKIMKEIGNTLVLFVTQANSLASVNQTISRATTNPLIQEIIPPENIYRSGLVPSDGILDENYMVVDFYNSRSLANMTEFVRETNGHFNTIVIVIDECDSGSVKGVKERLSFVRKIEKSAPDSIIKVIFVTATICNLSKSILQVANADLVKFSSGVINAIVNDPVVEHQFAKPHETYVGASWFRETPDVWTRLLFPRKDGEMTKDDYKDVKETRVMEAVKALPKAAKELTLIVTSTRTCDHSSLAQRLYRCGYNVTVEMNGANSKNYRVNYVDNSGKIATWAIPFSQIDSKADNGDLETFHDCNKKVVKSGITQKEDYTMSHVLQAALFMMTREEARIKENISSVEYNKLEVISNAIQNLDKSLRKPDDYPEKPRVALIAGLLASRGITVQNPFIDFTCTSFCFTDTRDVIQRGALNMQRFGRACGSLMDAFARPGRKPVLIATEGIMRDALANEEALREKAESIENGTLIALKELVTKAEWDRILKATKENIKDTKKKADTNEELVDGVSPTALLHYFKSKNLLIGKMIRFLYKINRQVTFAEFKEGIEYTKSDGQFINNINTGRGPQCLYGKLWTYNNNNIELTENMRNIINNIH